MSRIQAMKSGLLFLEKKEMVLINTQVFRFSMVERAQRYKRRDGLETQVVTQPHKKCVINGKRYIGPRSVTRPSYDLRSDHPACV